MEKVLWIIDHTEFKVFQITGKTQKKAHIAVGCFLCRPCEVLNTYFVPGDKGDVLGAGPTLCSQSVWNQDVGLRGRALGLLNIDCECNN